MWGVHGSGERLDDVGGEVMNETENHVSDHRKMDKTQSPDHVIKVGDGRRNRLDELSVYFRMAKLLIFAIALLVPMLTGIAAGQAGSQNQETYRLWAAMSVQQPVIPKNRVNNLALSRNLTDNAPARAPQSCGLSVDWRIATKRLDENIGLARLCGLPA